MRATEERTPRSELAPSIGSPPRAGAGRAGGLGARLRRVFLWVIGWLASRRVHTRGRYLLARLDDRALRDLGIDRAEVETESTASFWRLR